MSSFHELLGPGGDIEHQVLLKSERKVVILYTFGCMIEDHANYAVIYSFQHIKMTSGHSWMVLFRWSVLVAWTSASVWHRTKKVSTISSRLNFRPAPREAGLRWAENFWLHLTTASVQCLHLLWAFFHWTLIWHRSAPIWHDSTVVHCQTAVELHRLEVKPPS